MKRLTLQSVGTVSRADLARHPVLWAATGVVMMAYALAIIPLLLLIDRPITAAAWLYAAILFVVAFTITRFSSPVITSPWNHAALAFTYVASACGVALAMPTGSAAIGMFMFTAPVIAFRLINRAHISAHVFAASVALTLAVTLTTPDGPTIAAAIIALATLAALSFTIAAVLELAEEQGDQLELLIRRDPLTGVGNRRLLNERLAYELQRHARNDRVLSVLMLDLNGFKAINDTLGHAAGDELLIAVASALSATVRQQDTVARPGGDEFCVLLPETSHADADYLAATIRTELAKIDCGGRSLTTGIGSASYPADATSGEDLLDVADLMLRSDKQGNGATDGRKAVSSGE